MAPPGKNASAIAAVPNTAKKRYHKVDTERGLPAKSS